MKHLPLTMLAAAVFALVSPLAHADFIVDDGSPTPKPRTTAVLAPAQPLVAVHASPATGVGRLVQVGAPMPGPALQGWADGVPLSLAMDQIVPSGWKLKMDGVDPNQSVSWRGGRSWHAILGDLAYGNRIDARIDWVDQEVTLGRAGSLAPALVSHSTPGTPSSNAPIRKEADSSEPVAAVIATPVAVTPIQPVAPPPPPVVAWTLDPSKTLRENVEAWAKRGGWVVVWEGADYPVVAAASFQGDFASSEGPLAQLIAAYDRSEQPLLARLTTQDKVVTVTNRNYVPTVVNPMAPSEVAPRSFPEGSSVPH